MPEINLGSLFDQVEADHSIQYRDPFQEGGRITRVQDHAWRFIKARQGTGPRIAVIGAKGAGKTFFGSGFAFHMGQIYPESVGCIISNSYTQAKDNAGALIMKMGAFLGFGVRFFQTKTVKGRPYTSLFVIDLDGKGYEAGKNSYILVRSFEAVNKLEGIELDWLWCEELQDARESDFVIVSSRVRGQNADNAIFIAAMPDDESHWMYTRLPQMGMKEESSVRRALGVGQFDIRAFENEPRVDIESDVELWKAPVKGVLFEPSIFENKQNLPPDYIDSMTAMLDDELADRWIYGRRTSMSGNRVAYNYSTPVHQTGRMSQVLCRYDPNTPIIVSIDFNVAPLCATVWQSKPWNDDWDRPDIIYDATEDAVYRKKRGDDGSFETEKVVGGFYDVAPPNRDVLAQIDEFEVWEGGTRAWVEEFMRKYGPNGLDHQGGIRVLGDSTGDRRQTSSQTTDWQIIQSALRSLPNTVITPGVQVTSNYRTGKINYINPERRDTFNVLNAALEDFHGKVWLCFLPRSEFPSGGAGASVQSVQYRGDGTVDESNDRKDGSKRTAKRTHFFDTVRYVVWDFRGGIAVDYDWSVDESGLPSEATLSKETFTSSRHGNSWGGLF